MFNFLQQHARSTANLTSFHSRQMLNKEIVCNVLNIGQIRAALLGVYNRKFGFVDAPKYILNSCSDILKECGRGLGDTESPTYVDKMLENAHQCVTFTP